jgi:hypothetical protein
MESNPLGLKKIHMLIPIGTPIEIPLNGIYSRFCLSPLKQITETNYCRFPLKICTGIHTHRKEN